MYPLALAKRLRDKGCDVLAALDVEVGLSSRSDDDVLAWAARNNRCVVTEKSATLRDSPHRERLTPGWSSFQRNGSRAQPVGSYVSAMP